MVRNLLWPTEITETPNVFQRAARVMHWICTAAAVALAFVALYHLLTGRDENTMLAMEWAAAFAAFFFLVGRGIRYVLAGE